MSSIMTYFESELNVLRKCGVVEFDENHKVISMEEKPQNPKSNYAVPPFYIYKKEDLHLFKEGLDSGCKVDAPGHYVEWVSKQTDICAYIMPAKRIDIGTLEDYNKVKDGF